MNFQMAGIIAAVAFVLSFLSGGVGGVPLLDMFLRALVWAVVGFGASLGIETLLKAVVPDLFVAVESEPSEPMPGPSVNITLDEESPPRDSFVEEVGDGEDDPLPQRREAVVADVVPQGPSAVASASASGGDAGEDEEMPEIGSFLDAFKPEAPEASTASDYAEFTPAPSEPAMASGEVTFGGETQDPALLARAVQTVLKRDGQGN